MRPCTQIIISSGAPLRLFPILLSAAALFLLISGMVRMVATERMISNLPGLLVALLFIILFSSVVIRNILFRERVCIACHNDEFIKNPNLAILCSDIVSIEETPRPFFGSASWSWDWFGFGKGKIAVTTKTGTINFGVGMTARKARETIEAVQAFCAHCNSHTGAN